MFHLMLVMFLKLFFCCLTNIKERQIKASQASIIQASSRTYF